MGYPIFRQYYNIVYFIGREFAKKLPGRKIGIYAGADKSLLCRGEDYSAVKREHLKAAGMILDSPC